jgi:DNA-binding CsgD family transcriptional regulator
MAAMSQLTRADLEGVLGFLRKCEAYPDGASLRAGVLSDVRSLIEFDSAALMPFADRIDWSVEPAEVVPLTDEAAFRRLGGQHPSVAWARTHPDAGAIRLSDLVTSREVRRLAIYGDFMKPLQIRHQLTTIYRARPDSEFGLALNRERRDFSDREVELLDILSPHISQLHRLAEERSHTNRAIEAWGEVARRADRAVVLVAVGDSRAELPQSARGWLRHQLPQDDHRSGALPPTLAAWLHNARRRLDANGHQPELSAPLVLERDGARLTVEYLPATGGGEPDALLLEHRDNGLTEDRLRTLGLTSREAEVLACVDRGLTDMQIAVELAVSPRTVGKHLEHAYVKLGVPNRMAAVAKVRAA